MLCCKQWPNSPEVRLLFIFVSRVSAVHLSFSKDLYLVSMKLLKSVFSTNFWEKIKVKGKEKSMFYLQKDQRGGDLPQNCEVLTKYFSAFSKKINIFASHDSVLHKWGYCVQCQLKMLEHIPWFFCFLYLWHKSVTPGAICPLAWSVLPPTVLEPRRRKWSVPPFAIWTAEAAPLRIFAM